MDQQQVENTLQRLYRLEVLLANVENNTRKEHIVTKWQNKRNGKVKISLRTVIHSIGDIDYVNQRCYMSLIVYAQWKEPRLNGWKNEDVIWNNQWDPKINFKNLIQADKQSTRHDLIYEPGNAIPKVEMCLSVSGVFKQDLKLKTFPLDYQSLAVNLDSEWETSAVEFEDHSMVKNVITAKSITGFEDWELCHHVTTSKDNLFHASMPGFHRVHPQFSFTCHVKRRPSFYMWNIVIIMAILVALTFLTFAIETDEADDRFDVVLTLLLTTFVFKVVISQQMPNTGCLTYLDQYIISCIVIQCLVAAQNAVGGKLPEAKHNLYDLATASVLASLALLVHLFFAAVFLRKIRERDRFLNKTTLEYSRMAVELDERWHQHQRRVSAMQRETQNEDSAQARESSMQQSMYDQERQRQTLEPLGPTQRELEDAQNNPVYDLNVSEASGGDSAICEDTEEGIYEMPGYEIPMPSVKAPLYKKMKPVSSGKGKYYEEYNHKGEASGGGLVYEHSV